MTTPSLAQFLREMRIAPRGRYDEYEIAPETLAEALATRLAAGAGPFNRTWTLACREDRLDAAIARWRLDAGTEGLRRRIRFDDLEVTLEAVTQAHKGAQLHFVMADGFGRKGRDAALSRRRRDAHPDAPEAPGDRRPGRAIRGGAAGEAMLHDVVADTATLLRHAKTGIVQQDHPAHRAGARFTLYAHPETGWAMARYSIEMARDGGGGGERVQGRTITSEARDALAGLAWTLARLRPVNQDANGRGAREAWACAPIDPAPASAVLSAIGALEARSARSRIAAALETLDAPPLVVGQFES